MILVSNPRISGLCPEARHQMLRAPRMRDTQVRYTSVSPSVAEAW